MDTKGTRTRVRVARDIWSNPRALGPGPEGPGQLVNTAVPWTKARVVRLSWLTPQALGSGPKSPVKDVQHRGPSDL